MNRWIRFLITLITAPFQKKIRINDELKTTYRVWLTEADLSGINASQVLMITEIARLSMVIRCGIFLKLIKNKWMPILASSNIRYIKPIKRMEKFTISSKMIGSDEKFWYMKHQLFNNKNEPAAVILIKSCYLCKRKIVPSIELLHLLKEDIMFPLLPACIQTYKDFEKQFMSEL